MARNRMGRVARWRAALALLGVALTANLSAVATARPWKPTPDALALDYAEIIDHRGARDFVLVFWIVPQMLTVASEETRELLDEYAMVGIVHAHLHIDGTASFDEIDEVRAVDGNGSALVLLTGNNIPPAAQGALTSMQGVLKKMIGPMGEGTRWLVFDAGAVRSCEKGRLSISYDGEIYTYDTPIPGCPTK